MPVLSYLAYPVKDQKQQLINELTAIEYCEVNPADNKEVIILITDTPDEDTNKELHRRINNLSSLQSLSLTFGHTD